MTKKSSKSLERQQLEIITDPIRYEFPTAKKFALFVDPTVKQRIKYNVKPTLKKLREVIKELNKSPLNTNTTLFRIQWKYSTNFIDDASYIANILWARKIYPKEFSDKRPTRDILFKEYYAWKKADKNKKLEDNRSLLYYTEYNEFWASIKGELYIHHAVNPEQNHQRIYKILKKHFGRHVEWNGSPFQTIKLLVKDKL